MRGGHGSSGPAPDPNSERSQQRGLTYRLLPREGFTGRVPAWPLGGRASARERAVWAELWRTPQAAMWNLERHRMMTIGHYCRLLVRCEEPDATAALHAATIRYADQLGLTARGLVENRWRLAPDELADRRGDLPASSGSTKPKKSAPVRRMRAKGHTR